MKALVLGIGRMGGWLVDYLLGRGYSVDGYDPVKRGVGIPGLRMLKELPTRVGYDLVVSAVPVSKSHEVAIEVLSRMDRGAYIDVSSVKSRVNNALKKAPGGVLPVSIHPLFGPGARGVRGRTLVLTPVRDARSELEMAKRVFEGARIVVMSPEEHDELMAYVITLPQVLGYLFRGCVKTVDVRLKTSSYRLQELASAVEADSPDLASEIMLNNAFSRGVVDKLATLLAMIKDSIDDDKRLRSLLRELRGEWGEWEALYSLAYKALDAASPPG